MSIFYGCDKDISLGDEEAFFVLECETNDSSSAGFPHNIKNFFFLTSTKDKGQIIEDEIVKLESNYRDLFIVKEECKPYSVVFSNSNGEDRKTFEFESMLQMLLYFANNTQYGWVLNDLLLKRAEVGITPEEEGKIKKILLDSIAVFGRDEGFPTCVSIPEMDYSFEFMSPSK